jgi:hypothetical protein
VSYARPDRARVTPMIDILEASGWSVFWDHDIPPGWTWDEHIGARLEAARVVLVVWSKDAVGSEFVRTEASRARRRRALIPVRIDDVEPPVEFERVHAADLIDWVRQTQTTLPDALRLELKRRLTPAVREARPADPPEALTAPPPVSSDELEASRARTREINAARKVAMEELFVAQQALREAELARDRALREKVESEGEASRLREELAVARHDADTTRELVMRDTTKLEEEVVRLRATANSLMPARPSADRPSPPTNGSPRFIALVFAGLGVVLTIIASINVSSRDQPLQDLAFGAVLGVIYGVAVLSVRSFELRAFWPGFGILLIVTGGGWFGGIKQQFAALSTVVFIVGLLVSIVLTIVLRRATWWLGTMPPVLIGLAVEWGMFIFVMPGMAASGVQGWGNDRSLGSSTAHLAAIAAAAITMWWLARRPQRPVLP